MQRVLLHQPDMAVYAGTFVEPAFAEAGVYPHDKHVLAAVIDKIGYVDAEGTITAA